MLHQSTSPGRQGAWPRTEIRNLRSYRLPEFVLGGAAQAVSAAQQHVHGHPDEGVLGDPLTVPGALAIQQAAQPGQLIKLVGPQPEFLALQALPLGSL